MGKKLANGQTLSYEEQDKIRAEWQGSLVNDRGWDQCEAEAADAGWDYIMDMYSSDLDGAKEFHDGGEACDMADCTINEPPWRPKDRERVADLIHEGMKAARNVLLYGSTKKVG